MAKPEPIFSREIFRFFKDLSRHNKKTWMDANRERYQASVVRPFRRLLEETAPAVLALDDRFDTAARNGQNFSRINRDIRFAKDKTPYRPQMYLKYAVPFAGDGEEHADIVPVHRPATRSWQTGRQLIPQLAPRNRRSVESSHDTFLYSQARCVYFCRQFVASN